VTEVEWQALSLPWAIVGPWAEAFGPRRRRLLTAAAVRYLFADLEESPPQAIAVAEDHADGVASRRALGEGRAAIRSELSELAGTEAIVRPIGLAYRMADSLCSSTPLTAFGELRDFATGIGMTGSDDWRCLCDRLRDLIGNPFRPPRYDPAWRTADVLALARAAYDSREFVALPILADALADAGCDDGDILGHLRGPGPHVRGCWALDLVLGKD
jgi:hypothetical protein